MTERLLSREQVFQNWNVDETSRKIGIAFGKTQGNKVLIDVSQWIAHHHTSVNDPYFYSAKKVNQYTLLRSKEQRIFQSLFVTCFATCIGVAIFVYWKTRPYFERKWAECQALAETKKYVIYKGIFHKFERYATAQDIWDRHEVGASGKYLLRNAFCITSPFWGLFGALIVSGEIAKSCRDDTIRKCYPYDIVVERSKDQRVCPSNFSIQEDVDPLTQDDLSSEKLQSPQMIYLSNYVTDAKAFMLAILRIGKKDFADPYTREEFSPEEREAITKQILAIFQITQEELNGCFEIGEKVEWFYDRIEPTRFEKDFRGVDEKGQFTEDAQHKLQYCFNDLQDATLPQIDEIVEQEMQQVVSHATEELAKLCTSPIGFGKTVLDVDRLMRLFSKMNVELRIPIGSISFPVPIKLTPFLVLEFLKDVLPPEKVEYAESQIVKIKEVLKRVIRSKILGVTDFEKELREDDRATSRIEHFEAVTGVHLREVSQEA